MRKPIVVGILIAVSVAVLGVLFLGEDNQYKDQTTTRTAQPSSVTPPPPSAEDTTQPGSYLNYSPDIIANTSGTKVLFFHAPWCPQCRALESDIKSKGVPEGVSIIKVDYDDNQALRRKYGVTIQTSLVKVDDQGNLIEKYVSYDEPNLESVKRNLL